MANAATRNNNPLNIKYGTATSRHLALGEATISPRKALDGGNFLTFNDPQKGMQAAADLLFKSGVYTDLPLEQAMRKWSGNGYGRDVASELPNVRIRELNQNQRRTLISKMAKREGYEGKIQTKSFTDAIDESRRGGSTDTQILEYLAKQNKNLGQKIGHLKGKAKATGRSDREVLNFISRQLTGKEPVVPSVPLAKRSIGASSSFEQPVRQETGGFGQFAAGVGKEIARTSLSTLARGITGILGGPPGTPDAKLLQQILPEKIPSPIGDIGIRYSTEPGVAFGQTLEDLANITSGKIFGKGILAAGGVGALAGGLGTAGRGIQEKKPAGQVAVETGVGAVAGFGIGVAIPIGFKVGKEALNFVGAPIKTIAKRTGQLGRSIQRRVLPLTSPDLKAGATIENVQKYGVGGPLGDGLASTQNVLRQKLARLSQIIAEKGDEGKINLGKVIGKLKERYQARGSFRLLGRLTDATRAIQRIENELTAINKNWRTDKLTLSQVIEAYRAAGIHGAWLHDPLKASPGIGEQVWMDLYHLLRKDASQVAKGDFDVINKAISELIPIEQAYIRRIPVQQRREFLNLTDIIGLTASSFDPRALTVPVIQRLMRSGTLARFLMNAAKQLGDEPVSPLLRRPPKINTSPLLRGKEEAFGVVAGIEPERDEQGKITGLGFNPTKAAIGLGLTSGISKLRGSGLTTKFLEYAKGKIMLSRQEIINFAKRPELEKGEADLLLRKLEEFEPKGKGNIVTIQSPSYGVKGTPGGKMELQERADGIYFREKEGGKWKQSIFSTMDDAKFQMKMKSGYVEAPQLSSKLPAKEFADSIRRDLLELRSVKVKEIPKEVEEAIIKEAKVYGRSFDELASKVRGSATQYGDYNPVLRKYGIGDKSKRVSDLGIDPEMEVTIYRGIDDLSRKVKRQIIDGDFVIGDFDQALAYTGSPKDVVAKKIKMKDLITQFPEEFEQSLKEYGLEETLASTELIYSDSQNPIINISKEDLFKIWEKVNKN